MEIKKKLKKHKSTYTERSEIRERIGIGISSLSVLISAATMSVALGLLNKKPKRKANMKKIKNKNQKSDMYDGKRRYAEKRMLKNTEINSLTSEQHEVLRWLCRVRHEMHTNQKAFFFDEYPNHKEFWNYILNENEGSDINDRLSSVKLPKINFNVSVSDYITDSNYELDFDNMEDALWYMLDFAEKINNKIERYLSKIDQKYGTDYEPTGLSRY